MFNAELDDTICGSPVPFFRPDFEQVLIITATAFFRRMKKNPANISARGI
jgi:hypothetical protein